jgi:hypothetical protein
MQKKKKERMITIKKKNLDKIKKRKKYTIQGFCVRLYFFCQQ